MYPACVNCGMCGNLLRKVVQYFIEHSFIKLDVSLQHQPHLTAARLQVFNRQIEKNKKKTWFSLSFILNGFIDSAALWLFKSVSFLLHC